MDRCKLATISVHHDPRLLADLRSDFAYRNRFAVGSQIQRRFADILKSSRTSRRHLEELESLGYLATAPARGLSPLFPKIYYVTGRGVQRIKERLKQQGKSWEATRVDRRGRDAREGYGAEKLLHEILTTEFLLNVWQEQQRTPDLKVLTAQRRSIVRHPAFRLTTNGRTTRLIPDAMLLARHGDAGMLCYFVEMDTGTMHKKQLSAKFRRYAAWANATAGREYLKNLYRQYGAKEPRAAFRLLVIVKDRANNDRRRLKQFSAVVKKLPEPLKKRLWLTSVARIQAKAEETGILNPILWQIGGESTIADLSPFPKKILLET